MATNFPTSLDTYTVLVDNTDNIVAAHPNDRGDAIEVLEAKVGVNGSAVTTSHDYLLTHLPGQAGNWDAGAVEIRAQTLESDVATGTAPFTVASTTVVTNLNASAVGGAALASLVQTTGNQTVAGIKTFSSAPVLPADTIDAITEIKSTVKSGTDVTLVTGTKGTSGNVVAWNADGDAVDGANAVCFLAVQIKAFVLFDGTTNTAGKCTVLASYNITDVDDNGTGSYTINWDTNFADANYCWTGSTHQGCFVSLATGTLASQTAADIDIIVQNHAGAASDSPVICVMAIGTQ